MTCSWNATGYQFNGGEWEYCARANELRYSGSDVLVMGWYDANSGDETHHVGQRNRMICTHEWNVYEWVWDWYGSYSGENQTDLSGPFGQSTRTRRGGGWCSIARDARVLYRVSPVGCGDFSDFVS